MTSHSQGVAGLGLKHLFSQHQNCALTTGLLQQAATHWQRCCHGRLSALGFTGVTGRVFAMTLYTEHFLTEKWRPGFPLGLAVTEEVTSLGLTKPSCCCLFLHYRTRPSSLNGTGSGCIRLLSCRKGTSEAGSFTKKRDVVVSWSAGCTGAQWQQLLDF